MRAEISKLRAGAPVPSQQGGDEAMGDEQADVDIDKVQSAYTATVAAFGKESIRATDLLAELEGLRRERQQARPFSKQLHAAEGRVKDKRLKHLEVLMVLIWVRITELSSVVLYFHAVLRHD